METNILLENGTNELEVLEFTLNDNHYGINVAKIREILSYQPVTPVPNAHESVEGIFMPRDTMITVISLKKSLGLPETDEQGLFIITNFNKLNIAFHVDTVVGIHRVSWAEIIKPDSTINATESGVSTGVIKMDDKLVVILDFEKIVTDISPETGLKVSDIDELGERRNRSDSPILIAEGFPSFKQADHRQLKESGIYKPDRYDGRTGSMGQAPGISEGRRCIRQSTLHYYRYRDAAYGRTPSYKAGKER